MKVLVVNAGSSSLKYQFIDMTTEDVICKGLIERIGISGSQLTHKVGDNKTTISKDLTNHTEAFNLLIETLVDKKVGVIKDVNEISAIGHRYVNAGEKIMASTYVDENLLKELKDNMGFAPLHDPAHIACIESCKKILPNVPNVIVLDTGFHATMPKQAALYAIAYEDYEKYQIRRYGAHGTSHKFVSQEAIKYLKANGYKSDKIVTCHLGNGSSITAVKNGESIDTSMGMTPLAGVPMGTRSGDIDVAAAEMIADKKGLSFKETINYLNKKCGFLGVSGVSSDTRDVYAAASNGSERAQIAIDLFTYNTKKYIGAYSAAMGGLDCIVFTGGIGENSFETRKSILENLEYLGVKMDEELNNKTAFGASGDISTKDSKVRILIIPTNEELVIARETKAIVENM